MFYFIMENDVLVRQEVDVLPQELEELYREVRQKYTIDHWRADSADDTSDAGYGYCYSNTFHIKREPLRHEMVLQDGKLVGFYVGYVNEIHLERDQYTKKFFLELVNGAEVLEIYSHSRYANNFRSWNMIIEETPAPKDGLFLMHVAEEDPKRQFMPADFDAELIASVEKQQKWEDSCGDFNGGFYLTLKLSEAGIADPDRVLKVLKNYQPAIVQM